MINAVGGAPAPYSTSQPSHRPLLQLADHGSPRPLSEGRERFLADRPTLSVIVVSTGSFARLQSSLSSLRPQCERAGAELLVIRFGTSAELAELAMATPGVRWIAADTTRRQQMRRLGMAAATGDIVAVREDDKCGPEGWVEMLRHRTRRIVGITDAGSEESHGRPGMWAPSLAQAELPRSTVAVSAPFGG